jgi:hypothetical protein
MVIGWWNVILIGHSNSMTVPLRTPSGSAGVPAGIGMALTLLAASMARSLRRWSSSPSNTTPALRRRITVQGTCPDGGLRAIIAHHAAVPAPPGGL